MYQAHWQERLRTETRISDEKGIRPPHLLGKTETVDGWVGLESREEQGQKYGISCSAHAVKKRGAHVGAYHAGAYHRRRNVTRAKNS